MGCRTGAQWASVHSQPICERFDVAIWSVLFAREMCAQATVRVLQTLLADSLLDFLHSDLCARSEHRPMRSGFLLLFRRRYLVIDKIESFNTADRGYNDNDKPNRIY